MIVRGVYRWNDNTVLVYCYRNFIKINQVWTKQTPYITIHVEVAYIIVFCEKQHLNSLSLLENNTGCPENKRIWFDSNIFNLSLQGEIPKRFLTVILAIHVYIK